MRLTIAICTWNRAALLDQTLSQMRHLVIPDHVDLEILVVNNHCTDETDAVIAEHSKHLPLKRLVEDKAGQSHARNKAVAAARGEYILWTDDDVLISPYWVKAYSEAFKSWPDAGFFGGPIHPWFSGHSPMWLRMVWKQVAYAYAAIDMGDQPLEFTPKRLPYGANMAVRMREQLEYSYDPRLGVIRNAQIRGDETQVLCKMLTAGIKGIYVPDATVRHYIPRQRQTEQYLRKYHYGYGKSCGRHEPCQGHKLLLGKPRWLWRRLAESCLLYCWYKLCEKPEKWLKCLSDASYCRGFLNSYRRE